MHKAVPASNDKSADAVSSAFIIGSAVMGHENEVRASMSVHPFKHFWCWRTNGLAARDEEGTIRRTGTAERQWYQLQSDQYHVARAMCCRVNPCRKHLTKAARQTSGRIRQKLVGPMAITGGQSPLGYPVISGTSSTCQREKTFVTWDPSSL